MPGEDAKKTASKDNLASAVRLPNSRYGSKSNLFNATGSRSNMAMDQATLIATALESGQRVYENSYKMRPERKYV